MTKGYPVQTGFMGWIPKISKYMLFATEDEYEEYVAEDTGGAIGGKRIDIFFSSRACRNMAP